jgi:hypothetical protein
MAMEQMSLDKEDINLLKKYQNAEDKERIRQRLMNNFREE